MLYEREEGASTSHSDIWVGDHHASSLASTTPLSR